MVQTTTNCIMMMDWELSYHKQQQMSKTKKVHEDLFDLNEALKDTIRQLGCNVQTKVRCQSQRLQNQRRTLDKVLCFQKGLTLKQNILIFIIENTSKKQQLLDKLGLLKTKNQQLQMSSANLKQRILESTHLCHSVKQQKLKTQDQFNKLEEQKVKRLLINESIKNQKQEYASLEYQNCQFSRVSADYSINQSLCSNRSSYNMVYGVSDSMGHQDQQNSRVQDRIVFEQPFNLFDGLNIQDKQTMSKQILNSLQNQLNPLKLDATIEKLQREIQQLRIQKYQTLKHRKYKYMKLSEKLKYCFYCSESKLQKMKKHIQKLKIQKFGQSFK